MTTYTFPQPAPTPTAPPQTVYVVASGDLRPSANVKCWPVQQQLEADVTRAVESFGWTVVRAHPFDEEAGHGFIDSQRKGLDVFADLPPDAPLLVVEAVWQYSHHVLAGLRTHRGPIMVVANWNGTFPGLVGLLNLTASLTKAGVEHSSLWSVDFPTSGHSAVCARGWRRASSSTTSATSTTAAALDDGRQRGRPRPRPRRSAAAREGDHRHLRRGLHGDVQRHLRRRAAQPHRHLQGALVAERPRRRDEPRQRRRGGRGQGVARRRPDCASTSATTTRTS